MAKTAQFPATQRIGILIFDDFEPIDVWGFVEAFTIARFLGTGYFDPPPFPFETVFVAKERKPVRSMNGPQAMPNYDIHQAAEMPFDVLMIPGGGGTRVLIDDPAMLDWVRLMDGKAGIMASVCTGAAILARCGLLDGKPAATNHASFDWVAQQGPKVLWDNVSRWGRCRPLRHLGRSLRGDRHGFLSRLPPGRPGRR